MKTQILLLPYLLRPLPLKNASFWCFWLRNIFKHLLFPSSAQLHPTSTLLIGLSKLKLLLPTGDPTLCILNVGSVPTLCILNVRTVHTFRHSVVAKLSSSWLVQPSSAELRFALILVNASRAISIKN